MNLPSTKRSISLLGKIFGAWSTAALAMSPANKDDNPGIQTQMSQTLGLDSSVVTLLLAFVVTYSAWTYLRGLTRHRAERDYIFVVFFSSHWKVASFAAVLAQWFYIEKRVRARDTRAEVHQCELCKFAAFEPRFKPGTRESETESSECSFAPLEKFPTNSASTLRLDDSGTSRTSGTCGTSVAASSEALPPPPPPPSSEEVSAVQSAAPYWPTLVRENAASAEVCEFPSSGLRKRPAPAPYASAQLIFGTQQ